MIRVEGLHKTLGCQTVLAGTELVIETGEVLALVGPSGTGKSVLLKHIVGLMLPDAGDVLIDGRSVVHAGYRDLRELRRRMGYVFQDAALLDSLDIRANLRLALDDDLCARNPIHESTRIAHALRLVNLDERVLARLPGELSGGMRKRIGVARAILNAPDIMLYDEPTTGLDPQNVASIHDVLLRARDALGATTVVITHDIPALSGLADRVALMHGGAIRFLGTPRSFLECDDPVVNAFIGRSSTVHERRS